MIQQRTPGKTAQRNFRIAVIATLIAAFGQITLGGVVRVTGSGLGCPDWPLCHGQIIPPFEVATLIEYTHRLSGSSLGILMIVTTVLAWLFYRSNPWIMVSCVIGLVMVIVAGVLGGLTVLTELAWWVRLIHLGIAEVVVMAMVFATVAGWRLHEKAKSDGAIIAESERLNRLVLITIVGTFLIILSGSYMVGFGAGSSCGTWPLCNGSLFPESAAPAIHMGHRFVAAIVGILVIATVREVMKRSVDHPNLAWAGGFLGFTFAAQIVVGAAVVWGGFSPDVKAFHLSIATLVWIALIFVAAMIYTPQRFQISPADDSPSEMPGLERLTS